MKNKVIRYISLAFLIIWMAVIFFFSAQEATESDQMSRGVAVRVAEFVFRDYDELDEAGRAQLLDRFYLPIRKLAHILEFFILGAAAAVFFNTFGNLRAALRFMLAAATGVLYSVSDEIHQIFVVGRACRFTDVLIDSAGVLLAVIAVFLISRLVSRGEKGGQQEH